MSLVDRMEVFSDERPVDRQSINIHSVLDQVKAVAKAGFARNIRITENYDPSLPPVFANRINWSRFSSTSSRTHRKPLANARTARSS